MVGHASTTPCMVQASRTRSKVAEIRHVCDYMFTGRRKRCHGDVTGKVVAQMFSELKAV